MDKSIFRGGSPEADSLRIVPPVSAPQADAPLTRPSTEVSMGDELTLDVTDRVATHGIVRVAQTDVGDALTTPPTAEFTRPTPLTTPPPLPPSPIGSPDVPDKLSPVRQLIGPIKSDTTLNERHPDWPPVKLHFHFGPHGHAGNFKAVPKLVRDADVYCHENTAGDSFVKPYEQFSQGPIDPSDTEVVDKFVNSLTYDGKPIRGTPMEMQVRAIAGTNIAVGHFDLRPAEGDPVFSDAIDKADKDLTADLLQDTFDDTLKHMESTATEIADILNQRDGIMLGPTAAEGDIRHSVTAGRFETEMERLFAERPELKDKANVRVVDTHGSAHSPLYHRAHAAGVDVERSFSEMPYVYRPTLELTRKVAFGRQPTREFLVQCLADETIRSALDFTVGLQKIGDDPDVVGYVRRRSKTFSEADARKLFDVSKKEEGEVPSQTCSILDKLLQEKGFGPLPWSRDEMYDDIAKHAEELTQKKERILAEDEARRRTAKDPRT